MDGRRSSSNRHAGNDAWFIATLILVGVGLLALILYSLQFLGSASRILSIASLGFAVAGAAFLIGMVVGFLFGIPHSLQGNLPSGGSENAVGAESGDSDRPQGSLSIGPNTNLEQISDWLTKILVGVGLTQIGQIPNAAGQLARYLSPGFGNTTASSAFAVAVVSYFVICGFLPGYLWTRLYMGGLLARAERRQVEELQNKMEQVRSDVEQVRSAMQDALAQDKRDATARELADRQLTLTLGDPGVTQQALNEAIAAASESVKATIFNLASRQRTDYWRDDKSKVERTIPIFQALVASDPKEENFRYRGQLGYALKDKTVPDYGAAEEMLTKAIQIRDRNIKQGWRMYELNRAQCRIHLDRAFDEKRPSSKEDRDKILADLREAAKYPRIFDIIKDDPLDSTITDWASLNGVDLSTPELPIREDKQSQ